MSSDTAQAVDGMQIRGLAKRQEEQKHQEPDATQSNDEVSGRRSKDNWAVDRENPAPAERRTVERHERQSPESYHPGRGGYYHEHERGPQYGYEDHRQDYRSRENRPQYAHDRYHHDQARGYEDRYGYSRGQDHGHARRDDTRLEYDDRTSASNDMERPSDRPMVRRESYSRPFDYNIRDWDREAFGSQSGSNSPVWDGRTHARDERYYEGRYERRSPTPDRRAHSNSYPDERGRPPPPFDRTGVALSSKEPSEFILITGIGHATEEELARGVKQLLKPDAVRPVGAKLMSTHVGLGDGAKQGTLHRVFVVREKANKNSVGFGFAQFMSIQDATAAKNKWHYFTDVNHPAYNPDFFKFASRVWQVSYAHPNTFLPDPEHAERPFYFNCKDTGIKICYWDGPLYASELEVTPAPVRQPVAKAGADEQAGTSTTKSKIKVKKRKAEPDNVASVKKLAVFERWGAANNQLGGVDSAEKSTNTDDNPKSKDDVQQVDLASVSYADHNKLCCLLCARQFKDAAALNQHERVSQLHQTNLKDPQLVAKAIEALKAAGITVDAVSDGSTGEKTSADKEVAPAGAEEEPQTYRDRAAERRTLNNQPKQPGQKVSIKFSMPTAAKDAKAPSSSEPAQDTAANKMMKKMGWSEGSGLGASGSGMVGPIETNLYAAGVGLGAQGGKVGDAVEEAARATRANHEEYMQKVKDTARSRYNDM